MPSRPPSKRSSLPSRREAARAITQLAHHENLTEVATFLEQFLFFNLPQLAPGQTRIDLEELLSWSAKVATSPDRPQPLADYPLFQDRVGVFWGLLLLSAQSKVELWQTEFYQDLKIEVIGSLTSSEPGLD